MKPLSTLPNQAYFSLGLYHLFRWVDQGIAPPRALRVLLDRDPSNDGSMLALDANGNPLGGIRNPCVDVPTAKYTPINTAAEPLIKNPSAYVAANGMQGARSCAGSARIKNRSRKTASGRVLATSVVRLERIQLLERPPFLRGRVPFVVAIDQRANDSELELRRRGRQRLPYLIEGEHHLEIVLEPRFR